MNRELTEGSQQASPEQAGRRLVLGFRRHVRAFLVVNAALNVVNAFTGRPWWAFWPLLATAFALALHYLFYKAKAADERWVDARVEELNLKSYDRSHIEGLKARHSTKNTSEDRGS